MKLTKNVEKAILVWPERDENGELWWLVDPPLFMRRKRLPKTKGPIYAPEQWKLLKAILELSDLAKPPKQNK